MQPLGKRVRTERAAGIRSPVDVDTSSLEPKDVAVHARTVDECSVPAMHQRRAHAKVVRIRSRGLEYGAIGVVYALLDGELW